MAVFRWGSAFDAFRDLEREMDRILRTVELGFDGARIGRRGPPVNIYELDDEYALVVQLPGAQISDLDLSVADRVVTIRGSRQPDSEIAPDRFRRRERLGGDWERVVSLPDRVREEEMYAELQNGVLTLHLPKAPSTKPRQIQVIESSNAKPQDTNEAAGD